MRLNKFIAQNSGYSRREADEAIEAGQVYVNDKQAELGGRVEDNDDVTVHGKTIAPTKNVYLILNKPIRYVCSRAQQDEKPTVYELLPPDFHDLKIAGRLDAESHGLVVLTNDGDYANTLMHPRYEKQKVYDVTLERALSDDDKKQIEAGVSLKDGASALGLKGSDKKWKVTMYEGRNRQIRRTFGLLDHTIVDLRRSAMADLELGDLGVGEYKAFTPKLEK